MLIGKKPIGTIAINKEDQDLLDKYNWFIGKNEYAVRNVKLGINKWTQKYLHREIAERMGLDMKDRFVDHINRIKLDCRRKNLRSLTPTESTYNLGVRKTNKIGVRGICWDKSRKKYLARLNINGKCVWQGRFLVLEEARKERRAMEIKYYGGLCF